MIKKEVIYQRIPEREALKKYIDKGTYSDTTVMFFIPHIKTDSFYW